MACIDLEIWSRIALVFSSCNYVRDFIPKQKSQQIIKIFMPGFKPRGGRGVFIVCVCVCMGFDFLLEFSGFCSEFALFIDALQA